MTDQNPSAASPAKSTNSQARRHPHAPLTLHDLIGDLVWPKLLGASRLALAPSRLGVAFFAVVVVGLGAAVVREYGAQPTVLDEAGRRWGGALDLLWTSIVHWDPHNAAAAIHRLFVYAPLNVIQHHWIAAPLLGALCLVTLAVAGSAICRSAACDAALGKRIPWTEALGFAVGRAASNIGALAAPFAVVLTLAGVLAVGGFVVFSVPVINVLGAVMFPIALVLAGLATAAMFGTLLGFPLLLPAIAAEGTDAVDAMQRAYAYALNRPLRLVLYALILVAQCVVAAFVFLVLLELLEQFAIAAAGGFLSDAGRSPLRDAAGVLGAAATGTTEGAGAEAALTGTAAVTRDLIQLWLTIPRTLGAAYFVSYFFSAATSLYLALRRINDGQDEDDIWMEGEVRSELNESLKGRIGAAAAEAGSAVLSEEDAE